MAKGLGKGLASLFSEIERENAAFATSGADECENVVVELPIESIRTNPYQPRKYFDEKTIAELAESIKSVGLIQPILVVENGAEYIIIAGERRYRACVMLEMTKVPCIIRRLDERRRKEIAIIENLQREDLNPMEEAEALQQLMDDYGLTQEQLGELVGKSRSAISNILRLNNLSAPVRALVRSGSISAGHARALITVTDEVAQLSLAQRCVVENLSVRELEAIVASLATPEKKKRSKKAKLDPIQKAFLYTLQQDVNLKVKWLGDAEKGKLIFEYNGKEELDGLLEKLKKLL